MYSSFTAITEREKEYYVFLLLLQTGMLGVFMALDFILFYVFWEVMLVPMYFLIGVWGGPRRLYAAIKFFLYTLVGSVLMLVGILTLYWFNSGGLAAIGLNILTGYCGQLSLGTGGFMDKTVGRQRAFLDLGGAGAGQRQFAGVRHCHDIRQAGVYCAVGHQEDAVDIPRQVNQQINHLVI